MHYRLSTLVVLCGLATSISGCGGAGPVVTTELAKSQPGLNGGTAYPIPGDQGFAEIVIERSKPGQPVTLAVYFLDQSAKKAITNEPSEVRAMVVVPVEDAPKEVKLTARAKSGKSEGKRFASEPGNFDFDELSGELFLMLSGQELKIPFAFR